MIAIIDYGLGNVKAFANIYKGLDVPFVIATEAADLAGASRVILPGVGAFDQAMQRLQASGMRDAINELALDNKLPVLGVCVGMQMLGTTSEEGREPGLGWIDADVVRFTPHENGHSRFVPHMGWNAVQPKQGLDLFSDLSAESRFYFLHSFFVRCRAESDVLAVTSYGTDFTCAVKRDNIYGVQFHPEKSHACGVQLLRNFAQL